MAAQTGKLRSNQGTLTNEPEKVLFDWEAPARPFKTRSRDFWTRIIVITSVLGLILFLVEGVMPVILIISILFLFYVLSSVEPENVRYSITNKGVKIGDQRTDLEFLNKFWFGKRLGSEVLVLETFVLPGRLELMIKSSNKESIRKALSKYLVEEKASPSSLDQAAGWLSKRLSQ